MSGKEEAKRLIEYYLTNSRKLSVISRNPSIEKRGKNIISVKISNDLTINIGDKVRVLAKNKMEKEFNTYYIANKIFRTPQYNNRFTLQEFELTGTSWYILPILGKSRKYFDFDYYFINAYLDIEGLEKPEGNHIFLVYRWFPFDSFDKTHQKLIGHKNFIAQKNIQDKRFVVYVFEIPTKFLEDIELFKQGQFINLSEDLKENIIDFHYLTEKDLVYKILTNDNKLRRKLETELGCKISEEISLRDKPILTNEILCVNNKK